MKNLLCIFYFLSIILTCHQSKAQNLVGVSVGSNLATPWGYSDPNFRPNYKVKPGYNFSFIYKNRQANKINFALEMLFVQKTYLDKSIYGNVGGSLTFDTENTLRYISFAPLLEYATGSKFIVNLDIGPSFGVLLNKRIEGISTTRTGHGTTITTHTGHIKNDFIESEVRLLGRLGFEIPLEQNLNLAIENSISLGFVKLSEEVIPLSRLKKTKDVVIQLSLLYQVNPNHEK